MNLSQEILSDVTIFMKYSRYITELNRRETWNEIVQRNIDMHIQKYPFLENEIKENYKLVFEKKVLPSLRGLQFGGKAIQTNNSRIFNCSYLPIDDYFAFPEIMFLLLGGTGVGYSVQQHHIEKLPPIKKITKTKRKHLIQDSIEGWADSIKVLVKAYFFGLSEPIFDYSIIRQKGSPLKTAGGKAPGPEPLKNCLEKIKTIFEKKEPGDQLTSLEVHDIICYMSDAVLSGGIRRSATISFFSLDDEKMLTCKYGAWWKENPQRARANNSVVLLRHRIKNDEFFELWEKIKNSNSGEPGVFLSNNSEVLSNPCCVSGETWILTSDGARKAKDLVGKTFNAVVENYNYKTISNGFWKAGNKEVFEVELKNGQKIKTTADHKFLTENSEWKELRNLKIGDKIKIANHITQWKGKGNFEEGWLIGELIGDGTFGNNAALDFWGENSKLLAEIAVNRIKNNFKTRSDFIGHHYNLDFQKYRVETKALSMLADSLNIFRGNKVITDKIEECSFDFYRGFLRGFFDSDGSIQGSQKKGVSVRLGQINLENLERVQRMLSRMGVISTIYKNRAPAGMRLLPDGKGSHKEYYCQISHELVISSENVSIFYDIIGFEDPTKQKRLINTLNSYKRNINKKKIDFEIVSIKSVGSEDVYDVEVDKVHEFDGNGFRLHNCEISLKANQFCNLCEINTSDVVSQEDLNERSRVASFIGTLQAGYTDFHYLRDIWKKTTEKEALLGIGMTGIASGNVLSFNMHDAAEIVKQENERVSKLIGINKAARTTCVKPSGTSSLVLGTSSGIHSWHAPYYIRRLRVLKNESIYQYLKNKMPKLIEDDFFNPKEQAIISIPVKAPDKAIFRNESALSFLERVKNVSVNWIKNGHRKGDNTHNISATISIKINEWADVGEWMWENKNSYNGLSVLPFDGGSYVQPPHQEITKEEYENLVIYLKKIDLKKVTEEEDNTSLEQEIACSSGACDISL